MKHLLLGVLLLASAQVLAQIQSLPAIEQAVKAHLVSSLEGRADFEFSIGKLDPRLRLPACVLPLETRFTNGRDVTRNNSVEVKCSSDKPWTLYVSARIEQYREVLVATRALRRNTLLSAADLELKKIRIAPRFGSALTDRARIVGFETTRSLNVGQPILAEHIRKPNIVKRGQQVLLSGGISGISVRVQGEAMMDGAVGDRIKVRNQSSQRVVEGVIDSDGVIRIAARSPQ